MVFVAHNTLGPQPRQPSYVPQCRAAKAQGSKVNGTLVFFDEMFQSLRKRLLVNDLETCAVLLASPVRLGENSKYIVKEEIYFSESDYAERSALSASLRSEVVFRVANKAKRQD